VGAELADFGASLPSARIATRPDLPFPDPRDRFRDHAHGIEAVVSIAPKLPFAAEFWLYDGV